MGMGEGKRAMGRRTCWAGSGLTGRRPSSWARPAMGDTYHSTLASIGCHALGIRIHTVILLPLLWFSVKMLEPRATRAILHWHWPRRLPCLREPKATLSFC